MRTLITGVHAYLQSINYVWLRHGLGPSLGCRWAWALAQTLSLTIVGLLDGKRAFISLSLQKRSDPVTSPVDGCRLCPCTILGWPFCYQFRLRSVMSLSLCWPESCTWVVSGIYVRVVIYMVELTRYGIVKLARYGT